MKEGYKKHFDGKLITVWSAPNYCYRMNNLASIVKIDQGLSLKFSTYEASPQSKKSVSYNNILPYFLWFLIINLSIKKLLCTIRKFSNSKDSVTFNPIKHPTHPKTTIHYLQPNMTTPNLYQLTKISPITNKTTSLHNQYTLQAELITQLTPIFFNRKIGDSNNSSKECERNKWIQSKK